MNSSTINHQLLTMHHLTFPLPLFRQYLRELLRQPSRVLRCPVGVSRSEDNVELIATRQDTGRALLISLTDNFAVPPLPTDSAGVLLLGHTHQRGHARAFAQLAPNHVEPLDTLRLIGSGMFTVPLTHPLTHLPIDPLTHSRTIGALGLEVWQRLTSLRYALIGIGRTGSRLALSLARLGAHHLTLIDPDTIEPHNLGEMEGVTDADVGKSKVEALISHLASLIPHPSSLIPIVASITHLRALHAAQASDVLFCCADHDSARLATAAIAALFCKPFIDIATGIFYEPSAIRNPQSAIRNRTMGADVRLTLPGETCLLCLGGLRDEAEARQVLSSADAERDFYARRDWQRERAGSLASLNHLAVSLALRLWEDFLGERIRESTWIHAEFDDAGRLTVNYPTAQPPNHPTICHLCGLTGWGEEGLRRVAEIFG
jgi:hypothetical protein